jgi:hypothetical protein
MSEKLNIPVPESLKVSVQLSQEDWNYVSEAYPEITKSDDWIGWGKFFFKSVVTALSNTKPTSSAGDAKTITTLQQQVEDLTIRNEQISAENSAVQARISELESMLAQAGAADHRDLTISGLESANADLEAKNTDLIRIRSEFENEVAGLKAALKAAGIPAGSVPVQLTDKELKILDHISALESKRTGQQVSVAILLKNVFFYVLVNGPHDMFKVPVGIEQLREVIGAMDSKA